MKIDETMLELELDNIKIFTENAKAYEIIDFEDVVKCNGLYIFDLMNEYLIFTEEEWNCQDLERCTNYSQEHNVSFKDLDEAVNYCLKCKRSGVNA